MPRVAVITRTRDRPLFLRRALSSVGSQTFKDLVWVVVNDAGDSETVDNVIARTATNTFPVQVLHRTNSDGMQAASNQGIAASDSEFVVIHDDDDSWEPRFLEQAIEQLTSSSNTACQGVFVHCTKVVERAQNNAIIEQSRSAYWDAPSVTLLSMARFDVVPPPICFLYRRAAGSSLKFYRERCGVLGDWDFNLRFLSSFDADVLPRALANYHWRPTAVQGSDGNSLFAARNEHVRMRAELLNEYLRNDLAEGRFGIGTLINLCDEFRVLKEWHEARRSARLVGPLLKSFLPVSVIRGLETVVYGHPITSITKRRSE